MTLYRVTEGVFVPARTAALLSQLLKLDRHRSEWRGQDAELDGVLLAWRQVVLAFTDRRAPAAGFGDGFATATTEGSPPQPASDCDKEMTSGQVADLLDVTEQAVTKAARTRRLKGRQVAGRWLFHREDVAVYAAQRSTAA